MLALGQPAHAQDESAATGQAIDASAFWDDLPDPLTGEAVREMVSRLSDTDVRALLIERLDEQAAASEDEPSEVESLLDSIESNAATFWRNTSLLFPQTARMPAGMLVAFDIISQGNGVAGFLVIVAKIIGILAVAYAVERLAGIAVRHFQASAPAPEQQSCSWRTALGILAMRLGRGLAGLFVFAVIGANLMFAIFEHGTPARMLALKMLIAVVLIRFATQIAIFAFAPKRPDLRLVSVDDKTAAYLTRQTALTMAIYGIGFGLLQVMWTANAPPAVGRFGYWVNFALHATVMWTTWRARDGITAMLIGHDERASEGERRFARLWPRIAVGLVFLEWLIVIVVAESGHVNLLRISTIITTLATIILVPFIDLFLRRLGRQVDPIQEGDSEPVIQAREATQAGATRCARVVLAALLVVFITWLWGIDVSELAEMGLGAQIAGRFVEVVLIALAAYGLWELVNILVSRRMVIEAEEAGDSGGVAGDEGGGGGSRLGTLLPLLRNFAQVSIIVLAILAVLGNLGVNIAPLLAGAGIVGLAIGFGAQTLVKDIVSGVFFLVDDAFRIGEYIDVGDVMGTVEKISIRSLRLRHHLGAVHTVPYGEIPKLTNFSRDWVIVKLKFRVPFETDIGQVKRIFKQIGKDLWADPELGPDFLEPFKSQGVLDVDDSAIIVRGKFTAKPGKQFLIKREIFVRVQQAFDEAGIPFARRQVLVHMPDDEKAGDGPSRQSIASAAAEAAMEHEQLGDEGGPLGAPA